ncbi:hypothetical protein RAS1_43310 [Phycisphaerae bacterium RAS1]|nr:hypothetical protein RAS1_43310 [Phycisphaerae bacterium RAS1]
MPQLNLFDLPDEQPGRAPRRGPRAEPLPAAVSDDVARLAQRLPPTIHLGTSSWTFPGWAGIVYSALATEAQLSNRGLGAYARHPLLRSVGIDRTYYAAIAAETFAAYARQTPAGFRFLIKAHELCVMPVFGVRNRYGRSRGEVNERFLEPEYASREIVRPCLEGLGEKAGAIVFQFSPMNVARLGGSAVFAERLAFFLEKLPRGALYAVELRNRELLTPEYVAVLQQHGAAHCFNVHPSMPSPAEQAQVAPVGEQSALVVRWMLHSGLAYEEAKDRYAPFDRLVDEDPPSRGAIALLALDAAAAGRPTLIIVNNKAEGSAPLSIISLARQICAGR